MLNQNSTYYAQSLSNETGSITYKQLKEHKRSVSPVGFQLTLMHLNLILITNNNFYKYE